MSLFRSVNVSATGLSTQRTRMDVIADNIANAETTRTAEGGPYRRLRVLVSAADGPDGGVQLMGVTPDETPFKRVYDPSHPDANAEGYVDLPNVDIATEMVDMMTASRAYEANARALAMSRDMLRDAIDILS